MRAYMRGNTVAAMQSPKCRLREQHSMYEFGAKQGNFYRAGHLFQICNPSYRWGISAVSDG